MKKLSTNLISVLLFSITFSAEANSQKSQLDSLHMLLHAKILMLPLLNSIDKSQKVCNLIEEPITFKILKAKGFASHIIFFKTTISWEEKSKFQFVYNGDLIFAYNSRDLMIYKITGFEENDFGKFYNDLSSGNIDYSNASRLDLKTKNRFTKAFSVENIDLGCLFDSIKKHKKRLPCEEPLIRLDRLEGSKGIHK